MDDGIGMAIPSNGFGAAQAAAAIRRSITARLLAGTCVLAIALAGCGGASDEPATSAAATAQAPRELHTAGAPAANPAMAIAAAGHGKLFDTKHRVLQLDLPAIAKLQDAIRADTQKALGAQVTNETWALVAEADKLRNQGDLSAADKRLLQGGATWRLLQEAPIQLRADFEWRLEELNARINPPVGGPIAVDQRVLDLIRRMRYGDPSWRWPLPRTYAQRCRDAGVPVPPDWAEAGTPWVHQGNLTTNRLRPGDHAEVWSYSDPLRRGACIALPRGSGGVGSAAGIICQSATTGAACFWDNKLRSVVPEAFIGWRGRTLRIADLKDGSNLASSCTGCHRGNTVFLIAPDDPTWAKVLRGPLAGPSTGTLTTRVERSTDMRGGHPRYVPLSTMPPRTGWDNPLPAAVTCSGACHETPAPRFDELGELPVGLMPPSCASLGTGCYGW
jgi:hypothetical protein